MVGAAAFAAATARAPTQHQQEQQMQQLQEWAEVPVVKGEEARAIFDFTATNEVPCGVCWY